MKTILQICVVILMSLFGCEEKTDKKKYETKTYYEIAVDEEFELYLASNPTTGYSWKWRNKNFIDVVDSIGHDYDADEPVLDGSGGTEIWKFKGVTVGTDTLKFNYCRSWEENSTIDSINVVVKVR